MPKYNYTAKSLKGEEKKGTMDAESIHELSRNLKGQGFILIKAGSEEKTTKRGFKIDLPTFGVPLSEKMFFVRNLKVMITAGLPLPRAIGALSKQVKNKNLKEALLDVKEKITKGKSLSEALSSHSDIFSELFHGLIKVGEESGTLEKVLETLALQLEKEHALKSKVKSAMVYPAVIISAMMGVGILMLVTVIPKLAETFEDLNVELPATTQFVIGLGNFLNQNWPFVLVVIFLLVVTYTRLLKIEGFKKIMDKIFLKAPVIAPIVKSSNSAFMLRTLSSLIAAGSPYLELLRLHLGL
jgi:type IV pilus assembly protein PilC